MPVPPAASRLRGAGSGYGAAPRARHQLPPGDKWLRGHGAQRKEKWEN